MTHTPSIAGTCPWNLLAIMATRPVIPAAVHIARLLPDCEDSTGGREPDEPLRSLASSRLSISAPIRSTKLSAIASLWSRPSSSCAAVAERCHSGSPDPRHHGTYRIHCGLLQERRRGGSPRVYRAWPVALPLPLPSGPRVGRGLPHSRAGAHDAGRADPDNARRSGLIPGTFSPATGHLA
jgi:hypothetical protein